MTAQPPTSDQVRDAWDAIAPRFDEFLTPITMAPGQAIVDRLDVAAGTRLLDVGCGSGALAIPAARRGAEVMAVDIAPRMIELLNARARSEGLAIDGRVMDAHALDLPDDGFDYAVSVNGVTMSPRLATALAEMVRVTRAGGTVLVAAFGPLPRVEFLSTFFAAVREAVAGVPGPPMDPPPPPFQVADPAVFRRVLAEAGLQDVTVDEMTWEMPVRSAADLWDVVTSSNPIGAQWVAGFDDAQRDQVHKAVDRLLRERFGGRPEGVLHDQLNVGVGTVPR